MCLAVIGWVLRTGNIAITTRLLPFVGLCIPVLIWSFAKSKSQLLAATTGFLMLIAQTEPIVVGKSLLTQRSYFGLHRVVKTPDQSVVYFNGTTMHGAERYTPSGRGVPMLYYHRAGPLPAVFAAFNENAASNDVAVLGLGTGSIVFYAKPGQVFTFYELDPVVQQIAENEEFFSFLPSRSKETWQITPRDRSTRKTGFDKPLATRPSDGSLVGGNQGVFNRVFARRLDTSS